MSHPTRAVTRPGGRRVADGDTGFTLVELAVSMGIMAVAVGALVEMLGSGQSGFRTQLAAADVQQRMRAAATLISGDLLMAGGGPGRAGVDGALGRAFPALRPARRGLRAPDGELAFARDRISIVYATHARSQTTLSAAMGSTGSDVPIHAGGPGCPLPACGFLPGMRALIFDAGGAGLGYDLFTVDRVGPATLGHPPFSRAYGQAAPPVAPGPDRPGCPANLRQRGGPPRVLPRCREPPSHALRRPPLRGCRRRRRGRAGLCVLCGPGAHRGAAPGPRRTQLPLRPWGSTHSTAGPISAAPRLRVSRQRS